MVDVSQTDLYNSADPVYLSWTNNDRQLPNIRGTQSQNINVSRLVLQLSLPNPLKPGVKLRMNI